MNDKTSTISRAKLQLHIDAALDSVIQNIGLPADMEGTGRLMRCLVRRTIREMVRAGAPQHPGVLLQAFMTLAVDTVQSMFKKGELTTTEAPVSATPASSAN